MTIRLYIILYLACISVQLYSQTMVEDCANGLDDDGDGLVDLNDADCRCKGIKDSFFVPSSLIPNPSFEDYNCCPSGLAQLFCSKNWIQASSATSDYYHTCGFKEDPAQRGYPPQPLPAGNGYVGFLDLRDRPGTSNTYKEYVGACLNSTMYPGKEYTLTFWIGFGRPGGLWGPRAITTLGIFGTSLCSNLPFGNGGWLCPTSYPGWVLLTSVTASGSNKWVKVKVKLRPTRTIEAIVIGPACPRADGYYYYWLDDLILEETAKFDSIYLQVQGNPCVDSIRLSSPPTQFTKITYQWYFNGAAIPGATSQNYQIPKGQTGSYVLRASDGTECELSNSYNYHIDSIYTDISQQICDGEIFKVGTYEFKLEGNYRIVIPSVDGCDSIVHLDLKVNKPGIGSIDTVICEGQNVEFNGAVFDSTGNYQIWSSTVHGCDSFTILKLKVIPTIRNQLDIAICEGSNFIIGQDTFSSTGAYELAYLSSKNCDSLVTLQLTVNKSLAQIFDTAICDGQSIDFGGIPVGAPGTYQLNLLKADGCDSLITMNLRIKPVYLTKIDTSFCEGNQLQMGSQTFDKSGIYHISLPTKEACDSSFEIKLNVLPVHQLVFNEQICKGNKYTFAGRDYDQSGQYNLVLSNQYGCDSVLTLNLQVNDIFNINLDTSICDNGKINLGGIDYTQAGTYVQQLKSQLQCDSIVQINLFQHKSYLWNLDTTLCQGFSINVGGQQFNSPGSYNIGLKSIEGCDSTVLLDLNYNQAYQVSLDTVICFDGEIVIDGKTYTGESDFTLQYLTALGCDSTIAVRIRKTAEPQILLAKKDLDCFGDNDGVIDVRVIGMDGPYKYQWNTGQTSSQINGLAPGNYKVSVIDNRDCFIEKEIIIVAPEEMKLDLDKKDADCKNQDHGIIRILNFQGGTPPFNIYLDGKLSAFTNFAENVEIGWHDVTIRDSKGCEVMRKLEILPSIVGKIELHPDSLFVILGDSVWLEVLVTDLDSIAEIKWTGPGKITCPNCLSTSAFIHGKGGVFKVSITDQNGCVYEEFIYVRSKQNYYVPNVFTPNGDNINDHFNLFADRSIENIEILQIYDRWGNQVYENKNFPPNGIYGAWDGMVNQQKATPGVYVFLFLFTDKSGVSHKLSGDLTLIR